LPGLNLVTWGKAGWCGEVRGSAPAAYGSAAVVTGEQRSPKVEKKRSIEP
jgi:hypothetical protein